MKNLILKLNTIFKNEYFIKFGSLILSIFATIVLINFVYQNKSEFLILLGIPTVNLFYFLILKFVFVFSNSYFQKISLKILNINIKDIESLKITSKSMLINQLIPFRGGLGYRMYYLKKYHKLKVGGFGKLIYLFYLFNFISVSTIFLFFLYSESIKSFFEINYLTLFFIYIAIIFSLVQITKQLFFYKKNIKIYINLFSISICSNFLQYIFIAYSYYFFNFENYIFDSLYHFIIHSLSSYINITPGSIGIREGLLLFFSEFFTINEFEIINIAILDRLSLIFVLVLLNLLFNIKNLKNRF